MAKRNPRRLQQQQRPAAIRQPVPQNGLVQEHDPKDDVTTSVADLKRKASDVQFQRIMAESELLQSKELADATAKRVEQLEERVRALRASESTYLNLLNELTGEEKPAQDDAVVEAKEEAPVEAEKDGATEEPPPT